MRLTKKQNEKVERNSSVVAFLTRDQGVAGNVVQASPASLCCVLEQDTFIILIIPKQSQRDIVLASSV